MWDRIWARNKTGKRITRAWKSGYGEQRCNAFKYLYCMLLHVEQYSKNVFASIWTIQILLCVCVCLIFQISMKPNKKLFKFKNIGGIRVKYTASLLFQVYVVDPVSSSSKLFHHLNFLSCLIKRLEVFSQEFPNLLCNSQLKVKNANILPSEPS